MVVLNRIYTKTGDSGETALVTGVRVPKDDLRIACYGTVDETNSAIGVARTAASGLLDQMLGRIQNDLFDLGSDLATPDKATPASLKQQLTTEVQRWAKVMREAGVEKQ